MAVYFIQGNLGAGKSIIAVGRIKSNYLQRGLPVATNLDINIEVLTHKFDNVSNLYRLPDQPRLVDLENLPNANEGYDESKNGAIVLDECATWLNSRSWNDKQRKPVIDWLVHARKMGWDVYFIIQSVKAIDAQIRDMLMEHVVTCKRLDRMGVPILGPLVKWLSFGTLRMKLPRMHIGSVVYTPTDQKVDIWATRGNLVYDAYDTKQIFSHSYIADDSDSGYAGLYQLVRPWHKFGRFMVKRNGAYYMRLSKIYFSKLRYSLLFISGLLTMGLLMGAYQIIAGPEEKPIEVSEVKEIKVPKRNLEYFVFSTSNYERLSELPNHSKEVGSMMVSDGDNVFSMDDLIKSGYSYRRISDCYHILESESEHIRITCQPDEIAKNS